MPHVDLLELPYFEGIPINALVSLIERMAPCSFSSGTTILLEGDTNSSPLYVATHGRVAVIKSGRNENPRTLAELDAPTIFGEIELFCEVPPVATVKALTSVSAFSLTRGQYLDLFSQHHPAVSQLTFNVARVACHRLAVADEMMAQLLSTSDLVAVRQAIFSSLSHRNNWSQITGAFKLGEK